MEKYDIQNNYIIDFSNSTIDMNCTISKDKDYFVIYYQNIGITQSIPVSEIDDETINEFENNNPIFINGWAVKINATVDRLNVELLHLVRR